MSVVYKKSLVKDIEEKKKDEEEQKELHEKYKEPDENVRIIEKSNAGKFAVRVMARVIQVTATILILILAAIGLTALIVPDTREALMVVKDQLVMQLHQFLPFLNF